MCIVFWSPAAAVAAARTLWPQTDSLAHTPALAMPRQLQLAAARRLRSRPLLRSATCQSWSQQPAAAALSSTGAHRRRAASERRWLAAAAAEPSYCMAVTHWAAAKERRDGTIARPSEDAYLFCSSALGVCDGVGGWEARGVDSGAYSRGLCAGAARALHDATVEDRLEYLLRKPLLLLQAGYQHACDQRLQGSSTALVRPHWCRSTHALRSLVLQPSCRCVPAQLLASLQPTLTHSTSITHAGGHTHRQSPPHGGSRRLRAARRP